VRKQFDGSHLVEPMASQKITVAKVRSLCCSEPTNQAARSVSSSLAASQGFLPDVGISSLSGFRISVEGLTARMMRQ
jgi:hypothetical protein